MLYVLLVIGALVIGGVGLGFYLGWFNLSTSSDKDKSRAALYVDTAKIKADKNRAANKLKSL